MENNKYSLNLGNMEKNDIHFRGTRVQVLSTSIVFSVS